MAGLGSMMMLREDRSRSNKLLGVVVASSSSSSSSSSTSHDIELNEDEIWGEAMTWRSSPSRASPEAVDSSSYGGDGYASSSSPPSSSSSSHSQGLSIPSDGRSSSGGDGAWRRHLTRQQSAPMNVPNWSKILGHGGGGGSGGGSSAFDGGDADDVGDDARIPPHELVARGSGRSRALAFSVCEGLKGRELCRVRNAVLKQTGFL